MIALCSFLRVLVKFLGECADALTGPCTTVLDEGKVKYRVVQVKPTLLDSWMDINVCCRQIIYHTRYHRPWVLNRRRAVYEVSLHDPASHLKHLDVKLSETVTYPRLCNAFLKWTDYPHIYAINAFLDRVSASTIFPSRLKG